MGLLIDWESCKVKRGRNQGQCLLLGPEQLGRLLNFFPGVGED